MVGTIRNDGAPAVVLPKGVHFHLTYTNWSSIAFNVFNIEKRVVDERNNASCTHELMKLANSCCLLLICLAASRVAGKKNKKENKTDGEEKSKERQMSGSASCCILHINDRLPPPFRY